MNIRLCALVGVVLFVAACSSSGEQKVTGVPFAYQEATVSAFMADCMSDVTVQQCLCVLDRFRADSSESAFLEIRNDNRYRKAFGAHAVACGAPQTLKSEVPSASLSAVLAAQPGGNATVPTASVESPSPGPTERKATNPEVCLQDRIAAAAAKAPDSNIPLEQFDRIKKECGM